MKKIYSYTLGLLMLAGLMVLVPTAQAHAAFNDNSAGGADCPTTMVANSTEGTARNSNACWPTSVTAQPGDTVMAIVYYHNTSSSAAHTVTVSLNQPSGSSTSQTFTGTISSSDQGGASSAATISLPTAETLTYSHSEWYPDQTSSPESLPGNVFSGADLGTINGYSGCPYLSGSSNTINAFCHQGWVAVYFTVGTTSVVTSPCQVGINTSTPSVQSGGYADLTWTSSNCTSVNVTSTNGFSSSALTGSQNVGPLYASQTYTINGSNSSGSAVPVSTYVTVNGTVITNNCTATLTPAQTEVTQGQTTSLSWYSSGCSYVNISGPNSTLSTALQGSTQTQPIYGTSTYTLTAGGTNTVNQSVTISAYSIGTTGSAPSAQTLAATTTGGTTATLNGYISSNSTCTYSYYGCNVAGVNYSFEYGTSEYSLTQQTPIQTTSVTSGDVSAYVANLLPNTTYYFEIMASNTYGTTYGGVLSFYTNGGASGISAITTVPDNVVATSARLNGLVTGSSGGLYNGAVTAYFEYGTTAALGQQTSTQAADISNISNIFDTITTTPNTTYYYAIVAVANGQTYTGSTVSFTTPGYAVDNGGSTTTVYRRVLTGTGGGSAFVSLAITDQSQTIYPGDTMDYTVTYQNISGETLSNAVLNVILPTGVTFRQSSQGILTTNDTVAATLGTLAPNAQGTMTIQGVTNANIIPGNNLVTTATIAFTIPSNAQDSAVAYVLNNVESQNNLAGLALFGNGFFPTTLLGWILLIGLLLIIILIARYYYDRSNAARAAQTPVTHVHYDTPPTNTNNGYTPGGYNGNNLPH